MVDQSRLADAEDAVKVWRREAQAARERATALELALMGLYAQRNNGRLADHLEEVCRKFLKV